MVALTMLIVAAPATEAGTNVLLLPDKEGIGTDALIDALEVADHTVEVGPMEYLWDGTNPSPHGFDVVIHLNGAVWQKALPVGGQLALASFVRAGGGYIGGQWTGFEMYAYDLNAMADLVLQTWPAPRPDNCAECEVTWTAVPGQEDHPVLADVPNSFTFFADGHDAAPLIIFATDPSMVLMATPNGGPAVTVRELEHGKVVFFAFAPNSSNDLTLQDPIVQQLYVNSVAWEAAVPTVERLKLAIDELAAAGAINGGQANALTTKLDRALDRIDRGQTKGAINDMWAFVNQVEAWIRAGVLTQEEGQPLLDMADAIIADLSAS